MNVSSRINYNDYWRVRNWKINSSLKPREKIMLKLIPPKSTVLDVGCGNSLLPISLRSGGNRVTVMDISSVVLGEYRKLCFETLNFDLDKIADFKSEKYFDFVILSEVLEHTINPEEIIRQLKPYTRFFLITVPNSAAYQFRYGLMFRGRFFTQWVVHPSEHIRFWSHCDFIDWLQAMGLTVEKSIPSDGFTAWGLFPFLPRLWKNFLSYRLVYWCSTI